MTTQHWPKTGAMLWAGYISGKLEETEVYQFACDVLCEASSRSLPLLKANSHPDFYLLQPAEENHAIKIDQIRALIEWTQSKPQIAIRKVALLYPAEAMNLQAANALLKTLEEVSIDSLFILVSLNPVTLPATILSRCQIVRGPQAAEQTDPLQAQVTKDLQLLSTRQAEPVALAASWLKQDVNRLLHCLLVALHQQFCHLIKAEDGIQRQAQVQARFAFLDAVYEVRRSLREQAQLNTQLILEALLIQYYQLHHTVAS